jgi:acetyltransferase
VARLSKLHTSNVGEFAVVVIDQWQRKGLGTELAKRLVQIGKNEKLGRLVAYTLRENKDMQHMCKNVGFQVRTPVGESECIIEMDL